VAVLHFAQPACRGSYHVHMRRCLGLQDFYAALDITGPSILKSDAVEKPNVGFDDIGGMEDVKRALRNLVRLPVDHMDKSVAHGAGPARLYSLPHLTRVVLLATGLRRWG